MNAPFPKELTSNFVTSAAALALSSLPFTVCLSVFQSVCLFISSTLSCAEMWMVLWDRNKMRYGFWRLDLSLSLFLSLFKGHWNIEANFNRETTEKGCSNALNSLLITKAAEFYSNSFLFNLHFKHLLLNLNFGWSFMLEEV